MLDIYRPPIVPPHPFELRPGTVRDIGEMVLVLEQANAARDGDPVLDYIDDPNELTRMEQRMSMPEAWTTVATDDKAIAGLAIGWPAIHEASIENEPDSMYLALLAVAPRYWRRQVGTLLLEHTAAQAYAAKKDRVVLWTGATMHGSRRFYEQNDYYLARSTSKSARFGITVKYARDLVPKELH